MHTKQRRIWKLPRGTEDYWVSKDFDHVACIGSYQGTRFLTYDDYRETCFLNAIRWRGSCRTADISSMSVNRDEHSVTGNCRWQDC